jgi:pimeloyl-ACP methyl ester carboxylesterase
MKKLLIIPLIFIATHVISQVKKAEVVQLKEGGSIYYETYGEGEPLFFLHGYTQSSKYWLPYAFDFLEDYQIFLIDLPEHGRSGKLRTDDLSLNTFTQQLNELVNYLGLDTIKAIGFSFGGDLLYHWASHNPDLIESMIVIGAIPRNVKESLPWMAEYISYKNREQFPWMSAYHQNEEQIKRILDIFKNCDTSLEDDELSRIKTRTLMFYGDNDQGIALDEVARIRKIIPNTDLMILPNSGHSVHQGNNFKYFVEKAKSFFKAE